jgi:hypothetical protein
LTPPTTASGKPRANVTLLTNASVDAAGGGRFVAIWNVHLSQKSRFSCAIAASIGTFRKQSYDVSRFQRGEDRFMKALAVLVTTLLLLACSSVGQKVASGINNTHLKGTVGKPYAEVMYEHPDFGKLIGREKLSSGDEVMKHVGDFGTESSNFAGVYGKQ